jgi:hypothetical protein
MTVTVRLAPDIERQFAAACRLRRKTKSAVVTELIQGYLRTATPARTPYELAADMGLVGCLENAPAAARDHGGYLKAKLRRSAKRARRALF